MLPNFGLQLAEARHDDPERAVECGLAAPVPESSARAFAAEAGVVMQRGAVSSAPGDGEIGDPVTSSRVAPDGVGKASR